MAEVSGKTDSWLQMFPEKQAHDGSFRKTWLMAADVSGKLAEAHFFSENWFVTAVSVKTGSWRQRFSENWLMAAVSVKPGSWRHVSGKTGCSRRQFSGKLARCGSFRKTGS
jgi:hypothetical protein